MRHTIIILTFLLSLYSFAQSSAEDEVQYQSAVDWLNSKLSYLYYDEVGEQWWNNTFYANDDKVITIKHIASHNPNTANIRDKTYTIRTFKIEDINPKSLKIKDVDETKGRIVKGKMLELRTYGFQDLIHKTINNRRGSSTSFLFLSFPKVLNDSISNYAEIVKQKLEQAILASTRVYPSGNNAKDIEMIFNVLPGSFIAENGQQWITKQVKPNVLKIERGNEAIEYFGFDEEKGQLYLSDITSTGIQTQFFTLQNQESIVLKHGESRLFEFHTLHSFSFNGIRFFRQ